MTRWFSLPAAVLVAIASISAPWLVANLVAADEAGTLLAQAEGGRKAAGRTKRAANIRGRAARKPLRPAPAKRKPTGQQATKPSAAIGVPKVVLTEEHAKMCKVKVGDPLPDFRLRTVDGAEQSLSQLAGKNLTVVCFLDGTNPYALEEFGDLEPQIAKPYASRGLNVVAIQEGKVNIARAVKTAQVSFPVLVDRNGQAFRQIATAKLPRTYLIDASRQVIWFDLEYSRTTRRDLMQAIDASLK